jgi:hypothetical protein
MARGSGNQGAAIAGGSIEPYAARHQAADSREDRLRPGPPPLSRRPAAVRDPGWFFVHVQKTGGDTIRAALGLRTDDQHKHRTAAELRDIHGPEAWDRAFTFSFVRNPWDRLVSWWSMIDSARRIGRDPSDLNRFFQYVLGRASTFEEFLRCDEQVDDSDGRKWIYRNQLDYLTDADGRRLVDFVGRFERLTEDALRLARQVGVPLPPLGHRNQSRHGAYTSYYTRDSERQVARRFARDIDAFGYRFGGP